MLLTGLRHGLESFGNNENRVRTAHTIHLNLKVCVARSGRVCGLATHAVDRGAGYGLLPRLPYLSANSPLMMAEVGTCMMVLLVSGWTVGGF